MSEQTYSIPGKSGTFRLVIGKNGSCTGCAVVRGSRDCSGIRCGVCSILELIPGTDAPAVDPRDVEIADLRAKLAAMESAKPLAEEIKHLRGMLDGANKELAHREEIDLAQRMQITILENQLAAKPLAVLPPLTSDDAAKFCADRGIEFGAFNCQDDIVHVLKIGYHLALSRIQPVDPEYLAALEDGFAQIESIAGQAFGEARITDCTWSSTNARSKIQNLKSKIGNIRNRLAMAEEKGLK